MKSISCPLYVFCHNSLIILLISDIFVVWNASNAFSRALWYLSRSALAKSMVLTSTSNFAYFKCTSRNWGDFSSFCALKIPDKLHVVRTSNWSNTKFVLLNHGQYELHGKEVHQEHRKELWAPPLHWFVVITISEKPMLGTPLVPAGTRLKKYITTYFLWSDSSRWQVSCLNDLRTSV